MFIRRAITLVLFFGTFIGSGLFTYANRIERLRAAEERLAYYQQQYQEIQDLNAYYQAQIQMLEDEEFVAMLARERFLKSLPGEIIFRTSSDSASRWESLSNEPDTYEEGLELYED